MRVALISFLMLMSGTAIAQANLFVRQSGNGMYVEHKVAAKENWYSVGRIYFLSPKDIASFNQLSMDKGLGIGQLLKIPLKEQNFSQQANTPSDGIRVLHSVQQKEGLFKVAGLYQVDKLLLKKWNGLSTDQINVGSSLTIGFLFAQTPVAAAPLAPSVDKAITPSVSSSNTAQQEITENAQVKKASSAPSLVKAEETIKQNPKSAAPVKVDQVTEVSPKPAPEVLRSPGIKSETAVKGYFAALYEQQSKEGEQQKLENSVYGIFKSTSGWQDGKYYVLMNNVVPGTVVKLVLKTTKKELFAKVLGAVPQGKESEGLTLRMSNATIAALGAGEKGSDVDLVWYN